MRTLDVPGHPAAILGPDGYSLINPDNGLVYYPYSVAKVIELVDAVLASGAYTSEADQASAMLALAAELDGYNNGIEYINWSWTLP